MYNAQGQKENEKSCIRKAELLYKSSHENRTTYTPPNILLSPLLQFPFSVGYLFLRDPTLPRSTVFVETSLLLLDLNLQKEGKQILDLECDVFSTAVDNKWAQAKAHELNKEYTKAEIWIKENLSIKREEPMSWLCLGRIRYVNRKYEEALEAYEKVRETRNSDFHNNSESPWPSKHINHALSRNLGFPLPMNMKHNPKTKKWEVIDFLTL